MTKQSTTIAIDGRRIGPGHPTYVIAELSANHNGDLERARAIVREAAGSGADAVKVQTYTADTLTIVADRPEFMLGSETLWSGRSLHSLYGEAAMPWEWQPELKELAQSLGLQFFSSPFDASSIDFLEDIGVPAYKIASPEIVDLALIERAASTGKPLILSTGMATAVEIDDAVNTASAAGSGGVALLRCNSAYPSPLEEMDLRTIPDMISRWQVPVGLSDHTITMTAAGAAVALGATLLEKHLTLARADAGPDSAFSLEPNEFTETVRAVRATEAAVGAVRYGPSEHEVPSTGFRRSLWIVRDIKKGQVLTAADVRSIRPSGGLAPKHIDSVVGRVAIADAPAGTPVSWELLAPSVP